MPASRGTLAAERAAGADVRVVYSARDAVQIAAEEPARQGRVRRHRLRDHRADHRPPPCSRRARRRARQLQRAEPAQDHAAAAAGASRPWRDTDQRLPPAGARERDHRHRPATTSWPHDYGSRRRRRRLRAAGRARGAARCWCVSPSPRSPSSTRAPCVQKETRWPSASLSRSSSPATPSGAASAMIPGSGLELRDGVRRRRRGAPASPVDPGEPLEPAGCRCGEVLRGVADPPDCALFGGAARRRTPSGPAWSVARAPARRRLPLQGDTIRRSTHVRTRARDAVRSSATAAAASCTATWCATSSSRAFANPMLERLDDAAALAAVGGRIAFTTDAHVVQPLEFPGGDIGRLARLRHRQRPGNGRSPAAGARRRLHHRGRLCRWPTCGAVCASMARHRRGGRRPDRHRRHQGRASAAPPTASSSRPRASVRSSSPTRSVGRRPRGRRRHPERRHRRPRRRHPGGARRVPLPRRGAERLRAAVESRRGRRGGAREHGGEEALRFLRDPTRGGLTTVLAELAERVASGSRSKKDPSRSRRR